MQGIYPSFHKGQSRCLLDSNVLALNHHGILPFRIIPIKNKIISWWSWLYYKYGISFFHMAMHASFLFILTLLILMGHTFLCYLLFNTNIWVNIFCVFLNKPNEFSPDKKYTHLSVNNMTKEWLYVHIYIQIHIHIICFLTVTFIALCAYKNKIVCIWKCLFSYINIIQALYAYI